MHLFLEGQAEKAPQFRYRPLTVDPDVAKRDLYAIDLTLLEDPTLERLLCAKRRELDYQLTMLATRNTPGFRPASQLLYGAVDAAAARRRPGDPRREEQPRAGPWRGGRRRGDRRRGAGFGRTLPARRRPLRLHGRGARRRRRVARLRPQADDRARQPGGEGARRAAARPRGQRPPAHLLQRRLAGADHLPHRPGPL